MTTLDAHASVVPFVVALRRKNTDALGFIPRARLESYEASGQIITARENGDLCGFLVFGATPPIFRIYQACVQYDARRRAHGFSMVGELIRRAHAAGADAVTLGCADDLAANEFWREAGFVFVGSRVGGRRRKRRVNRWVFYLPHPRQGRLFHCETAEVAP